jgi:cytochrome c oxidase assembly protein subunit 16
MPTFQRKTYAPNPTAARYRALVQKHPFFLFGLPFITIMVAGSFFLTPATAIRYERYDKKVQQMSNEEALNVRNNKRKVDMKEEYYVSGPMSKRLGFTGALADMRQKLAAKDIDNWEQQRVKRLPGEPDGIL